VVEHGGFRRAVSRLYLSQPAVSRQVAELERAIGVPLFVRDKGRSFLTPAGERFAERAQTILDDCADAIRDARASTFTGTLRVGVTPGGVAELTRPILRRLGEAFPGVDVSAVAVKEAEWSEAPRADLDLLLVRDPVRPEAARSTVVLDEPMVITTTAHLGLPDARISLAQAVELPMLRFDPLAPPRFRHFWTLAFARGGIAGDYRGDGATNIRAMAAGVAHGLGAAVASPSLCRMYAGTSIRSYAISDGPRVRGLVTSRIDDRRPLIDEAHRQIEQLVGRIGSPD
jgi:DNA-binding transcriptional LysR family regulator